MTRAGQSARLVICLFTPLPGRTCLAFIWPSFVLVCACLRSFTPTCLCALICGSLLPCYTCLAFVWAHSCSSGLWLVSLRALQPLVYVYIKYTISTYMLIN